MSSYYPNRHSSLRHAINSVQIEKLRDRRSSLEEEDTFLLPEGQPCLRRRDKRDLRDVADIRAGWFNLINCINVFWWGRSDSKRV